MLIGGRPAVAVAALAVLGLQAAATVVALLANLPSQFGAVGEDASDEFVSRGTAVSAPVLPLVLLAVAALLAFRRDRWGAVGAAAICVLSVFFAIGSLGEAAADGTADVSKAVLVASGIVGTLLAAVLFMLGVLDLRRLRRA